jgi:hypothetical protein
MNINYKFEQDSLGINLSSCPVVGPVALGLHARAEVHNFNGIKY